MAKVKVETVEQPSVVVHPVAGMFLVGVPHRPLIAPEAIAERLVRTGAFTSEPPPSSTGALHESEVIEFPEASLAAALDFYSPIPEPEE